MIAFAPNYFDIYMCKFYFLILVLNFFATSSVLGEVPKFKIGLVLPLTGTAADYGIAIQNSINLAIKDRPELFTNITWVYEDATFDTKTAVTALNQMVDYQKVDLVVTWGVAFCQALSPIAESKKIPLIGICLDPNVARDKQFVIRFKNKMDEIMQVQSKYLSDQGKNRIGVLLAEHPYLEEVNSALERNLHPGQTLEVIDRLPNGEADFRTRLIKITKNQSKFDVIGVFLFVGQISTFYRQAKNYNFSLPTFGTDLFESLSEIKASQGMMEGVHFASINIKPKFIDYYKSIYKNESQLAFGAPAYELALTIGELFNQANPKPMGREIIKSFSKVTSREGVASGPYKYVNDSEAGQYFQFPVVMKQIRGDRFEVVN